MSYRGLAPSFVYKIDHRFPRTGDFKSNGKKYTLESDDNDDVRQFRIALKSVFRQGRGSQWDETFGMRTRHKYSVCS